MDNTPITTNSIPNTLPGWAKLEYTFLENIDDFSLDGDKVVVELILMADWAVIETRKITQNCEAIEGDAYQHDITAQIACRGTSQEEKLRNMKESALVLRLTDNNGRHYIAGCPEEPIRMKYESKDANNPAEGAIYTLKFACVSRNPLMQER